MAENYREQQQEEMEGIVDAGGVEDDAGTGMIAEDQETAAMANEDTSPAEAPLPSGDASEAAAAAEAAENVHVDLHEDSGSGLDVAVIVIILLVVIGCLSFGIANATKENDPTIIAQKQAQKQAAQEAEAAKDYTPSYEIAELPEGVAAIVNGEVIEESAIDAYVANFRSLYELQDDGQWAAWLLDFGYTPEFVRDSGIVTYVDDIIVAQGIEEYGIEVPSSTVDEIYNAARDRFATEEEWQAGLKQAGLTEESFREQCENQAAQRALTEYLGEHWFATPEDKDAEMLVAVKQYYPKYAEVESLDGISAEELEPVRELVEYYAQQDAYAKFMQDARENGDIKMSAPSDLPYDANMLLGLFQGLSNKMAEAQAEQK